MISCLTRSLLIATLTVAAAHSAESMRPAPDFDEVYSLVRAHLEGSTPAELNRLAVDSFIAALRPKVSLVGAMPGDSATNAPALSKALLLDGPVAYLRVAYLEPGLPQGIREACRLMAETNKLAGLVLDLRFTTSDDYAAAASTADLFLKQDRKMLDWGKGMVTSKEKTNALALPVAVLVNHETAGASEALAAALRQTGTALILGSESAGLAMDYDEFPLKNGQTLRIATGPVRLGDGADASPVKPDIAVEVSRRDERAYYADGFRDLSSNLLANARLAPGSRAVSTNRVRRPLFNEAELVRERKEGISAELDTAAAPPTDDKPVVHDPALARALDVLKGLAVVRAARGN